MDNVGYTTQTSCTVMFPCKLRTVNVNSRRSFKSSTWLTPCLWKHQKSTTPRALHLLLLQKLIWLNQAELAGPGPANHMTVAEVKQKCSSNIVWLPLYIQPLRCLHYINITLGKWSTQRYTYGINGQKDYMIKPESKWKLTKVVF